MNLRAKRKAKLSEFTIKEYGINGGLMAILFLFGLFLSWKLSTFAGLLYVLLWVASYFIIHATTCRNCVYHGKQCPVPFEGSCSHLTFDTRKQLRDICRYRWTGGLFPQGMYPLCGNNPGRLDHEFRSVHRRPRIYFSMSCSIIPGAQTASTRNAL